MSQAKDAFEIGLGDAKSLLDRFDIAKKSEPPDCCEVLKRASLIFAATAWETYVEDRLRELVAVVPRRNEGSEARIVDRLLERDIATLHNPSAERVRELFQLYAGMDVTEQWTWPHYDPDRARRQLNEYLKLRGDAVHRARVRTQGPPKAHLVRREELAKAIRFFVQLVEATDLALAATLTAPAPSLTSSSSPDAKAAAG